MGRVEARAPTSWTCRGSRPSRTASINNQTEIGNGERGHYLVWSVRVKG